MTLDLFGSTLRKESNGYQNYKVLGIFRKRNVTIFGGTIEGDKNTHDYTTVPGTHEWGIGIDVSGLNRNIKIDSVKIKNTTGYGVRAVTEYGHLSWIYTTDLESGTFNNDGTLKIDANFTRSNRFWRIADYPQIKDNGYFSIMGNGYGAYGSTNDNGEVNLDRVPFTIYFFDDTNKFLGKITKRTFDNVYASTFPQGTTKFKITFRFNYNNINTLSMTIRSMTYTKGLNIVNTDIEGCRALGIAITGAQNVLVDNCEIYETGGVNPGYGIDIEDGYNINQNIIIRNSYIHDNYNGAIVVVSARNVLLEGNKFYGSVFMGGARGENYLSQHNLYNCTSGAGVTNAGGGDAPTITFYGDYMLEGQVYMDGNAFYHNVCFDNVTFLLQSDTFKTTKFKNCYFYTNRLDLGWVWLLRRGSLVFEECKFNVFSLQYYYFRDEYFANTLKSNITMRNCDFNTSSNLGSVGLNNFTLIGNTFNGTNDVNWQQLNVRANNAIILNNKFDSVGVTIDGNIGTSSKITMKNNNIIINKTKYNPGPDRCEGFLFRKFDYVYFENNEIYQPTVNTTTFKLLMIYGERLLKLTGNTFIAESSNNSNSTELWGAYRVSGDLAPIPTLEAIIKDNYSKNWTETYQSNFISQLGKPIIGDGMIPQSLTEPTVGFFKLGEQVKNTNPMPGGYLGWICVAQGYADTAVWNASKIYAKGNRITANNNVYEAQNNGKSMFITPTFPIIQGGTVEDKVGATTWAMNKAYVVGNCVVPTTTNGYYYECTTAGTSGATEPICKFIEGETVTDGTVIWTVRQIIKWRQVGGKAAFRTYGLINEN
ncbi:right-handed parallel beta-helix repeat-containing protein [Bacillus cereus]|uniref:right-handed parallel beta-helix repeat-containing protein n=1 Tax=Bacillus cereus TaxID=1396 RepID=UPI0024528D37|nr:right-handed parallel beta-helix repeat-containing protein [Bacillus cereus]